MADKKEKETQDSALWDAVTKDIVPLDEVNESKDYEIKPVSKPQPSKNSRPSAQQPRSEKERNASPAQPPEIDRRTAQRLQRGQMPIDGRVDLHGLTQNQAYDALCRFIPAAARQGKRCILIITGKGSYQESGASLLDQKIGVLKQKTPEWLNSPPLNQYILKIQTARPQHGGDGALYVLLRKR